MSAAKAEKGWLDSFRKLKDELLHSENFSRPENIKDILLVLLASRTVVLSILLGFSAWELSVRHSQGAEWFFGVIGFTYLCLLYTSPSPRDATLSRMPSSA